MLFKQIIKKRRYDEEGKEQEMFNLCQFSFFLYFFKLRTVIVMWVVVGFI